MFLPVLCFAVLPCSLFCCFSVLFCVIYMLPSLQCFSLPQLHVFLFCVLLWFPVFLSLCLTVHSAWLLCFSVLHALCISMFCCASLNVFAALPVFCCAWRELYEKHIRQAQQNMENLQLNWFFWTVMLGQLVTCSTVQVVTYGYV